MRVAMTISVFATLVVLAAGCGGDVSSRDAGGDRLTRAEYVAAADAICREAQKKSEELGQPGSPEEMVEFLGKSRVLAEEEFVKLTDLNPPEADDATVRRARDLNRQLIDLMSDLQSAVEANDTAKFQEIIDTANRLSAEADEIAAGLGLKDCRIEKTE